jgi:Ca-activated chloride channel family protein
METEDVVPSRIKKARHLVKSLVDQLKGDRVGLVAFAASSYVACPLTTDTDYVLDTLQILGPKMIASQGTDIGIGLDTARKALERGAEEMGDQGAEGNGTGQAAPPQPSHVVILISDGEDHEDGAISAAKAVGESGAKLYVLGVGTEKGGPVPVRDDVGNLITYKKDRKGETVVSTFRPDELMKVAQAAGGRYWNVTSGEDEVREMLQDMGALNRTEYAERRYLVYEDRFQFPLALAVLLAFVELSMPVRRIRRHERDAAARSEGPGAARPAGALLWPVVAAGAALLGAPWGARDARAASLLDGQPPVEAYLDNEKGLKAFKDGKIEEAEKQFGTAQALDPGLPELQYNQGVIQMQKGDTDSAARDFEDAARSAMERHIPHLEAESLYNLGGALAKKGDVPGAVRSYLGAIGSAQRSKDPALEDDARRNLQLLIHERQKQKQQQQQDEKNKQDQQKKDGKQDQKQDQGGGQDQDKKEAKKPNDKQDQGKSGDQSEQAKNQPKQYEDPSQSRARQFNSPKLSKDDAERVMAELSNREKELQARIKKQNGIPQQQINEKDW